MHTSEEQLDFFTFKKKILKIILINSYTSSSFSLSLSYFPFASIKSPSVKKVDRQWRQEEKKVWVESDAVAMTASHVQVSTSHWSRHEAVWYTEGCGGLSQRSLSRKHQRYVTDTLCFSAHGDCRAFLTVLRLVVLATNPGIEWLFMLECSSLSSSWNFWLQTHRL